MVNETQADDAIFWHAIAIWHSCHALFYLSEWNNLVGYVDEEPQATEPPVSTVTQPPPNMELWLWHRGSKSLVHERTWTENDEMACFPTCLNITKHDFSQNHGSLVYIVRTSSPFTFLNVTIFAPSMKVEFGPDKCGNGDPPAAVATMDDAVGRMGVYPCSPHCGNVVRCPYINTTSENEYLFQCICPYTACSDITLLIFSGAFDTNEASFSICCIRFWYSFFDIHVSIWTFTCLFVLYIQQHIEKDYLICFWWIPYKPIWVSTCWILSFMDVW